MPFITILPSFYAPSNKSNLRNSKFISQAISKLLKNNYIEELDQKPYCCNPLTVTENKKLRFVLDLCHVNSFIKRNKFRYENLTLYQKFCVYEIISRLSICHLAIITSKYIQSIENILVLSGHMKMGLENIFSFALYSVVSMLHLLSVGEVSALRLLFISMTVLQHPVVSSLPKQPANSSKTI